MLPGDTASVGVWSAETAVAASGRAAGIPSDLAIRPARCLTERLGGNFAPLIRIGSLTPDRDDNDQRRGNEASGNPRIDEATFTFRPCDSHRKGTVQSCQRRRHYRGCSNQCSHWRSRTCTSGFGLGFAKGWKRDSQGCGLIFSDGSVSPLSVRVRTVVRRSA